MKYIPETKADDAILNHCEKTAALDYRARLDEQKQTDPINQYDFNRGFEYGIQCTIDYPEWFRKVVA